MKLFRKIRFELMEKNRIGKPALPGGRYLKYAFGEIILVVIGILIALSINNWNQEQQQMKVLKNIYGTLKSDLLQDIKNIDRIVNSSEIIEEDYLAIINRTRTREDFKSCVNCKYVNFGFPNLKLRKNGSELLQNYNQQNNMSGDSLSVKLNRLYVDLMNDISIDLEEISVNSASFLETVKYSQAWFADLDFSGNTEYDDDFIDYALNDIGYRNTTKLLHVLYFNNYIPHLLEYRAKSVEIIAIIDEKLADE